MRKQKYMLALLLILAGCALLKNNRKTIEKNSQNVKLESVAKTVTKSKSNSIGRQIILRKDDSRSDFTIRFWPKGTLKFTPAAGFAGEFDSVLMHGKRQIKSDSKMSVNTMENISQASAIDMRDKRTANESKNMMAKLNYTEIKTVIVIIIVCILTVFVFTKVKKYR